MKALSLFAFLFSLLVLGGCQKDDSSGSTPKTKTELITSSSWKYNDAKIDADNNGTGDQPIPAGFVEACQLDNTITFTSNGSGSIDEGPTKCDAADPQSLPFTWSFTSNETIINFSSAVFAGIGGDFKIVSLTETELIISQQVSVLPPPLPAVTVIASFKH
jgi:hypothetical protein